MTHVSGYFKKDGTYVKPHEDKRGAFKKFLDKHAPALSHLFDDEFPEDELEEREPPRYPNAVMHPEPGDKGKPIQINQPSTPTPAESWADKSQVATVVPGGKLPSKLNGIAFKPWKDHPETAEDWDMVEGQDPYLDEPPFESLGKPAAGVVIEEPDGRVWVIHPTNQFGGYRCVPQDDSEILTRAGWRRHDQVQVGDETLGFDPESGGTRWTKILSVHHYDDAPMIWFGGKKWGVRCTPNHRWLVCGHPENGNEKCGRRRKEQRLGSTTFAMTDGSLDGIAQSRQLVVSAPRLDEPERTITGREAAIIAWIVTDGHIAKGKNGKTCSAVITQGKKVGIEALDKLLRGTKHTKSDWRSFDGCYHYRISADAFNGLLERTGWDGTKASLPALVLGMDNMALKYFMEACWLAEGDQSREGRLWQNDGPVLDAMALAGFMLGKAPVITGNKKCKALGLNRPMFRHKAVDAIRQLENAPAWCVTTELGTWTMRQRGVITLTGNSTFPKGRVEDGINLQASAIKEAFEESGLKVEITGFLMDVERSVTTARYYTAKRVGGTPAAMGWEAQAVSLVPRTKLYEVLNSYNDHPLAEALGAGPQPPKPPKPSAPGPGSVPKFQGEHKAPLPWAKPSDSKPSAPPPILQKKSS